MDFTEWLPVARAAYAASHQREEAEKRVHFNAMPSVTQLTSAPGSSTASPRTPRSARKERPSKKEAERPKSSDESTEISLHALEMHPIQRKSEDKTTPPTGIRRTPLPVEPPRFPGEDEVSSIQANTREVCIICLSGVREGVSLDCGHSFCESCIIRWFEQHSTCPTCRAHVISPVLPEGRDRAVEAIERARSRVAEINGILRRASLPPSPLAQGLDVGTPNTVYVWCVCWRRLVIPNRGISLCPCGHSLDPIVILQKNITVSDLEQPVSSACNPSNLGMTTRAANRWCLGTTLCLALSVTAVFCPLPAKIVLSSFCEFDAMCGVMTVGLAGSLCGSVCCCCACLRCNCFADRLGRLDFITWDRNATSFCCFHPATPQVDSQYLHCVASDTCMHCLLCCNTSNRIWVV